MLETLLVPCDLPVQLVDVTVTDQEVCVTVMTTAPSALCPVCQCPATRVHSRYTRSLRDTPLAIRPLRLQVRARRFFCRTVQCPRWIFTERLPPLARPYAQRTTRLTQLLCELGLALGGEAGARLARVLGATASPASLLQLVRQLPTTTNTKPARRIGIDDWAFRRGRTYGTIICNLDNGTVLDVLPNREADTVAAWLLEHPQVEIISRDRAGAYAEAADRGAPQAQQVADRWHLLKNLGDALEELLNRVYSELIAACQAPAAAGEPGCDQASGPPTAAEFPTSGSPPSALDNPLPSPAAPSRNHRPARRRAQQQSAARRARRLARYEEVCRLRDLGWSQRAIAAQLQLDRRTVRCWLRAGRFPEHQPRPARSRVLDPHKAYLQLRWQQGCQNARQLADELRVRGYRGSPSTVRDYVASLRRNGGSAVPGVGSGTTLPRPRLLKWMLLRPVAELSDDEYQLVRKLCAHRREVTLAYGLVMDFQALVRERQGGELASWVALAQASGITELAGFARGLLRDWRAVVAGLELTYSQGPVEGQVNRLKMLKRQMYGRAKFDLLRLRVLYAH